MDTPFDQLSHENQICNIESIVKLLFLLLILSIVMNVSTITIFLAPGDVPIL